MNIFAIEGHKVKIDTFKAGYDYQKEIMMKLFDKDKVYTVDKTIVHSSSTDVYLKEFPNTHFNSVFFKDVTEQSIEDTMKHEQYYFYNTF